MFNKMASRKQLSLLGEDTQVTTFSEGLLWVSWANNGL